MSVSCQERFERHYEAHLKHLRLKGLQPKTIEAYARAVRTVGAYFDGCCVFHAHSATHSTGIRPLIPR